jgi:hypothetical protein
MARIRTVKPDITTSTSAGNISREARLFFVLLLLEADDDGRLEGSAKRLAGSLYPRDNDVGPAKIEKWLAETVREDMVHAYTIGGVRFLQVVNFLKHQKISHPTPSRIPPEPGANPSGDPPENRPNDSGDSPEAFRPDLGKGKEQGKGREGEEEREDAFGFDAFWSAYPRKEAKGEARKAWGKAAKRVDPAVIITGALAYHHDPNRDPAFTAHPATWLNADRWEDDPLPPRPSANGTPTASERSHQAIANVGRMLRERDPSRDDSGRDVIDVAPADGRRAGAGVARHAGEIGPGGDG